MSSSNHGCRDIARLISQSQDMPLAVREQLRLRWHLLQCQGCRQFSRQIQFMKEATKQWRAYSEQD